MKRLRLGSILILGISLFTGSISGSETIHQLDFAKTHAGNTIWKPTHDIESIEDTPDGVVFHSRGDDPYSMGLSLPFGKEEASFLNIEFKSDQSGQVQVFYFNSSPNEQDSIRISCTAGQWIKKKIPLPPLSGLVHFRFDPPSGPGATVLKRIEWTSRRFWGQPDFALSKPSAIEAEPIYLTNGDFEVIHSRTSYNNSRFKFMEEIVGMTHPEFRIVIIRNNGNPISIKPISLIKKKIQVTKTSDTIISELKFLDPDNVLWTWTRSIIKGSDENEFDIHVQINVNQPRQILYLAGFRFFYKPDAPDLDPRHNQALFPGIEYLDLEPSSSEKNIVGIKAWRKMPLNREITWPMIALLRENHLVHFTWETMSDYQDFSPLFDSPDRVYETGGHVMGLIFPPNVEGTRPIGSIIPHEPVELAPERTLVLKAHLQMKEADSLIPAIQDYSQKFELPKISKIIPIKDYIDLAIKGWLHSRLRTNEGYKHAVWLGRFNPMFKADILCFLNWFHEPFLSLEDSQKEQITAAIDNLSKNVPESSYFDSTIGHIGGIWPSLVLGKYEESMDSARSRMEQRINAFKESHRINIQLPQKSKDTNKDLSETHYEKSTNGNSALQLGDCLELGIYLGDHEVIKKCLELADNFLDEGIQVPRGAQPWEIPIHAPDILASAYLVRLFQLCYVATGNRVYLEQATKWAWTGVPFVYLVNPTNKPIGQYSTIPVLGATHYVSPNWIGLPVQWCGLVYAQQLYLLDQISPNPSLRKIADGITATGIQHCFDAEHPTLPGLLPDYVVLQDQLKDGPAINPGTLQINIPHLYGRHPFYQFEVFPDLGFSILYGCKILGTPEKNDSDITFNLDSHISPTNIFIILWHETNLESNSIKILQNDQNPIQSVFVKEDNAHTVIEIREPTELLIEAKLKDD